MAEKKVKITFEVDGVQQTVNSVEELNDALKDTSKESKKAADSQGFFSKKTAEFKEKLNGVKDTLKEVGTGIKNGFKGLKNFASGFKTASGAAKGFGMAAKAALAATGIGLLVTAVVSLIEYFKNLEGGARTLQKIMAGLGSVVTSISTAFSKLIKGDFTGAKEAIMGIKDAVVEATEAVDDQFDAESRLSKLRQRTIVENAKLNQEIEKQKKILEDSTLSTDERLAALDKVTNATKQLALNQKAETEEALRAAQADLETINNYEEKRQKQEEIAELQASLIDQQTQLQNIEYDAAKVAREIRAAEAAEKEAAAQAEKDRLEKEAAEKKAIADKEAAEQEKRRQEKLAADKKASEEAIAQAEKEAKEKRDLEEAVAASKDAIIKGSLATITQIAGEQSAIGKAAAVSQATINTYQAATNALANTPAPPPFPQIAAAATVASGLAQVRKILSVGGADGGTAPNIQPPSAPRFSTSAINVPDATGFSNVVTRQGNGETAVRAYVVAGEVTNQQEANKRINDLARL